MIRGRAKPGDSNAGVRCFSYRINLDVFGTVAALEGFHPGPAVVGFVEGMAFDASAIATAATTMAAAPSRA